MKSVPVSSLGVTSAKYPNKCVHPTAGARAGSSRSSPTAYAYGTTNLRAGPRQWGPRADGTTGLQEPSGMPGSQGRQMAGLGFEHESSCGLLWGCRDLHKQSPSPKLSLFTE